MQQLFILFNKSWILRGKEKKKASKEGIVEEENVNG
jgi:hypothetical protein